MKKIYSTLIFCNFFRFRIPNVTERLRRDSDGRTFTSNLVFTIWAVFGGFILHFLLSNYLTVLLRPRYEEPVESAADLIKRDITPFVWPGGEIFKQLFQASPDSNYQELSKILVIPKDSDEFGNLLWDMGWKEYGDLVNKVTDTGLFAQIGTIPFVGWYRSTEKIAGTNPFGVHLSNKKWPMKKVL